MFKNKTFVLIGKIQKRGRNGMSKEGIKRFIESNGGKHTTSISNRTHYVIFPSKITPLERQNKQLRSLKKVQHSNIHLVYDSWVVECRDKQREVKVLERHKVLEFYDLLPTSDKFFDYRPAKTPPPLYNNIVCRNANVWKEYITLDGSLYFFNVLDGRSTFNPSSDFSDRLIGGISMVENQYYTKETRKRICDEVDANIKVLEGNIEFLQQYQSNYFTNKKRQREGVCVDERPTKKRKKKKNVLCEENKKGGSLCP
jgi:hypothetical protein